MCACVCLGVNGMYEYVCNDKLSIIRRACKKRKNKKVNFQD